MVQPDFSDKDERGQALTAAAFPPCLTSLGIPPACGGIKGGAFGRVTVAIIAVLLCFMPSPAHAACSNPAGDEGAIVYNADQNVPQVCTQGDWTALGVINPAAGGTGCTNPVADEGAIIYNADIYKPQYCDGDDWVEMLGTVSGGGGGGGGLSGPSGCANIGDLCADGTVFAGYHPVTHDHLFIPTTDQERPGSPGTYTMNWKNASGTDDINPDSNDDGRINHANRGGAISDFQAFQACEDLSAGGHTDWYLPSRVELYYLWTIRGTIESGGNTTFQSTDYWPSTEYIVSLYAWYQNFADGNQFIDSKTSVYRVRCVRR